ncbi:MAG: restriction endonuclease subunit S [Phocaeicola sp.]|uniref:restriction endonuclease subunit S n=1 Tax=Phocaeicola sp. TaxID=2773926 RepID=UPI003FA01584
MSQFIEMFGGGNWPQKTLGEVGSFTRGGGFQKSDFVEHGIPCIHYGQIHTKLGPFITSHITEISSDLESKTRFASKGDLVIAITSEDIEGSCKSTAWLGDYPVAVGGHAAIYKHSMNPLYMSFFFKSILFNHTKIEYVHGTKVFEIKPNDIAKILVPCPPMSLQNQFSAIAEQADKSGFDGLKSQFIEMFGNPLSSVQRYPLKKLGDCCELNPRRPSLGLEDTDNVSFVPMPSVSENGYLQDVTDEEYGKVKKGFTYFENGDVLFAKITPCMENGKGAIAEGLTNNIGMGSTEFHVLRPIENVSSPYWLLALTRLPIFRERASKNMTGTGGQKRVPANYLENFMVGLPPIEEQNRFENIYNQADKSGSLNQYRIAS